MRHYGLIGEHLGHSLSVPIREIVFRELQIRADYTLVEIPKDQLSTRIPELLREMDGFNVTVPYKKDIIPFLEDLHPLARRVMAVNTVCSRPVPAGYNTDVHGFSSMLQLSGISPEGRPCLILGTGGASLAVSVSLSGMGASSVTFVSRHPAPGQLSYEELETCEGLDRCILVNCTPVGMFPGTDACPLSPSALSKILPRAEGVADLIYNPRITRLAQAARDAGVPCCTGMTMLIAQALEAEEIWQGRQMPSHLMKTIEEALL